MCLNASSVRTFLAIRPITTASSPSWSTRWLIGSSRIGSRGPITAVEGLRNTSGSSGTSIPNSAACAA
jgi:hypothetical protein